jgi:hypothetical protein
VRVRFTATTQRAERRRASWPDTRHLPPNEPREESPTKKLIVALILVLAGPCLVFGQTKPQAQTPAKGATVEQELMKLEEGWAVALVKPDLPFLERILADGYVATDSEGTVWNKAQSLALLKSGEDKFASCVTDNMRVRVYGNAAVVTGHNTAKETLKGRDISGQTHWTDTWVRQGGLWKCVASHWSNTAEK